MKKIVALLMALCMVFALCACGQSAAPAATEAPAADAAATEAPAADSTKPILPEKELRFFVSNLSTLP